MLALLLASLTATSMLLLALVPAPLVPDAARSLYAPSSVPQSIGAVFDTTTPMQDGHWKNVYIHHSKGRYTANSGNAGDGMGDHFLIGNGDGLRDGEIQIGRLWEEQKGAMPAGANVSDNCISICLVGDFEQRAPTATQIDHLQELVKAIQDRCQIPSGKLFMYADNAGAGGIGRLFPTARFFQYLER